MGGEDRRCGRREQMDGGPHGARVHASRPIDQQDHLAAATERRIDFDSLFHLFIFLGLSRFCVLPPPASIHLGSG